tara:strand:- start:384 stop:668 length:285 start_codon:yes stop_codon:yes gene_type:complete
MRGVGVVDYLALPSRAPSGPASARSGSAFGSTGVTPLAVLSAAVLSPPAVADDDYAPAAPAPGVAPSPARALFPFRKNFFSLVVAGIVGSSSSL